MMVKEKSIKVIKFIGKKSHWESLSEKFLAMIKLLTGKGDQSGRDVKNPNQGWV